MHRILLVNAEYPDSRYDYAALPVGLGYLSETLSKNGIEHKIFDLNLGGGYEKLKKTVSSYGPDIIGYSMMSFRYKHNYSILNALKKDFPEIKIVAGGPHISTFRKNALSDCRAIDIGVMMEGEEALVEICMDKPPAGINGSIYRDGDGNIILTGQRELIRDLDRTPFPRYGKLDIDAYPKEIAIVTSRGCPYKCIFCPIASVAGDAFRPRSAPNVLDEVEFWYKKGVRDFSIADDTFNFIRERVRAICNGIKNRGMSGLRICCGNGIRADRVDRDLLVGMKNAGFYLLAFGVESGSDKVLKTLKKGEDREKIEEAIDLACRLGFWVELFFLIGSPGETWADFEKSVKLALRYPVYDAKFYNLIPFPNTELYKWVEENDYFLISPPGYLDDVMHHVNDPIFATPELSAGERKRAFRYASGKIRQHTEKRRTEFEKGLIKEKLDDYYGIRGMPADLIARLYCLKWFNLMFKWIKKFKRR